jgi:hypothetical protein
MKEGRKSMKERRKRPCCLRRDRACEGRKRRNGRTSRKERGKVGRTGRTGRTSRMEGRKEGH